MIRALVFALAVGVSLWSATAAAQNMVSRYVAGQDYKVIDNPAKPADQTRIRVTEFFLYSCPHCFHFEPTLENWLSTIDADVSFGHSPVLFGRGSKTYARIFYTERQLGVTDRLHDAVFDAIHKKHRPLQQRAAIRAFFKANGVSNKRFDKAFDSQAVKQAVAAAGKRMQRFGVRAVPSMSVAGRYWISGRTAGSNDRMLKVVNYLIEKTRSQRRKANDHAS